MSAPTFELDAMESMLRGHPDVVEVAAFRTVEREPPARVVAIVLGPSGTAVDVRDHVWDLLAARDRPDILVALPALPRDPSGAVDTAAIERTELDRPGRCTFAPPRTATEVDIAAIWREVLGRARISTDDNFLDLGGDSMTAALLLDLTNERLGVDLSLDDLFATPSLVALADSIDQPQ